MSDSAKVCAAVAIAHVDGQVVLVAEPKDQDVPQLVAVLSPREAHHLRSRLHKAANDAAAAAARGGLMGRSAQYGSEEVLDGRLIVNVYRDGRISLGSEANHAGSMNLSPLELAALLDGPLERALDRANEAS